jgi:predicted nucleic acid-binding protein
MNGINLVVDTNILINLAEGKSGIDKHLTGNDLYVSVITEIELLGWPKISNEEKLFFKKLIMDCKLIELMPDIRTKTIELKQEYRLKVPDAIIAATALYLDLPLLSYDSGFEKIKQLNLLLLS